MKTLMIIKLEEIDISYNIFVLRLVCLILRFQLGTFLILTKQIEV